MNIATQQEPLQKLIQQIVELVHPSKIIVFGSVARGTPGPQSDTDLLVVMPEGVHRRHTAQLIYKKVQGIKTPFDLIVATSSDLEKNKENPGLIYKRILEEGKQLYAA